MTEDVKKILDDYKADTERHFDVVAERLEDKIILVSEQVAANTEKLTEHGQILNGHSQILNEHSQRFDKIDGTLEVIKLDIEFIKNELKQKVARDEFAVLEKRVSMLEAKMK